MKLVNVAALALLAAIPALAADFAVGDRVHVGSTNKDGTVLAVGDKMRDGGTNLKIHLDGAPFPANVGVVYDSAMSQVTRLGGGPVPAPANAGRAPKGAAPAPQAASNNQPPGRVDPSPDNCKQAIRANYPATGDDQTITVSFQSFSASKGEPYEAVYANDNNGRGHTVNAMTIKTKYQVLTHFADPLADDQQRSYDAEFKCYNAATSGELIAEQTMRAPGSEHATYIHKGR